MKLTSTMLQADLQEEEQTLEKRRVHQHICINTTVLGAIKINMYEAARHLCTLDVGVLFKHRDAVTELLVSLEAKEKG